jgi:hypothetical protein
MLEIIAAVASGFGAAGVAMLLRALTGSRLPRWLVPAAAGGGMLGFAVWAEYAWFQRIEQHLPAGAVVVEAPQTSSPLRPWTYLRPLVTRAVVADGRGLMQNPELPGIVLLPMTGLARWQNGSEWVEAIDCAAGARAVLREGVSIGTNGRLIGTDWAPMAPADPRRAVACKGG